MAEKRITTVDEITSADPNADYVLVVRGAQQDVKRFLLRRLPQDFDLHDDVADELTTLANADRMLISDEGSPGAPNRYVQLQTLQSFFTNMFDLHDDVATELTEAADADRLLISDEDEAGDPQKWISVKNLLGLPREWADTTRRALDSNYTNLSHSLGRTPTGFRIDLECVAANSGWSIGDKIIDFPKAGTAPGNGSAIYVFGLYDVTATNYSLRVPTGNNQIPVPHKTTASIISLPIHTSWQFLVTLY